MQAFLIDPENGIVAAVEYAGDYREIYRWIDAERFDAAQFNEAGDAAFIDDDGLGKYPQWFFTIEGYHQPLAGKGLVLGCDADGETVAPSVTLDWLVDHTTFYVRATDANGRVGLVGCRARDAMATLAERRGACH